MVTTVILGGICAASEGNDFNFHGLKLGTSEKLLAQEFPEFSCSDGDKTLKLRRCKAFFDFSKRPGVMVMNNMDVYITFRNDKLVNISFPWYATMFDTTLDSFKKYYGNPVGMDSETFKTKGGKTLNNKIYVWNKGKESIIYTKHYSHEQVSRILFLYKEDEDSSTFINDEKYVEKTQNPSQPAVDDKVYKNKHYRSAFSGKTVSGRHSRKGFKFKDYFGEDGTLIEIRENGKRKKGDWTIDTDNTLCIIWENKKSCAQLEQIKDGSFSFSRNDKEIRRYKHFEDGNTLE